MAYVSDWEQLADALERVTTATGLSNAAAQADICRAISDGAIEVRAELGEHATRPMRSRGTILKGEAFDIPTTLKPEDLDWQQSRPLKPWPDRREVLKFPGYWNLERIELLKAIFMLLVSPVARPSAAVAPSGAKAAKPAMSRQEPPSFCEFRVAWFCPPSMVCWAKIRS